MRALAWLAAGGHGWTAIAMHSDSTCAIVPASNTGIGPDLKHARNVYRQVSSFWARTAGITWVKGHAGTLVDARAGELAGKVAERLGPYTSMSLAHLKLRISEPFRTANETSHTDPKHHGTMEIPPPHPKKSILDRAGNRGARTVAQIRTGHRRSVVYLNRIRTPGHPEDECWFCNGPAKMTRSHVQLHCRNPKRSAARLGAWEGRNLGDVRVLLANP